MRLVVRGMRWIGIGSAVLVSLLAAVWVLGNTITDTVDMDDIAYAREHLTLPEPIQSEMVETHGIRLHVVSAGPRNGPPVILLHGHPDFWWGWRRQFPALVAAGFRVIAPDLRGFNRSGKPSDVESYRIAVGAEDIRGLIDALGYASVYVVGHDSGAAVAWQLAGMHPERVRGIVSFAVGHLDAYRAAADKGPFYPLFNAFGGLIVRPGVPKFLMRPFDWLPLTLGLKISGHGSFDQQELDLYRASWAREDAFTHMFFWTIRKGTAPPELGPISTPVLIVALPDDPGIPVGPARQSARHCSNLLLVELPHVGHWVQREAPERTNELIIEFVRSLERG